jgi:hypothetical protein
MNKTKVPLLIVPLGGEAHRFAQQFAAQQATPQKGKRVYFNTLAVYSVNSYLKWLQIETSLRQSDSWHPGKRAVFDVADLALPGIGKLECRPVLLGETACYFPPEVTENRIGYIGVQFGEILSEVKLLGFARAVDADNPPAQLQIADFQPLDALIDHINQLKAAISSESQTPVNLSRWLENVFEGGWQNLEALLDIANLAWSFRSPNQLGDIKRDRPETIVRGGKLIDLGIQLAGHPVALAVTLIPEADQKINVILQLHPAVGQMHLPQSTRLIVLDKSGEIFLEVQARSADNFIQLQFSGIAGERFRVEVALGVARIREDFVI